jgi:hypothetical protein
MRYPGGAYHTVQAQLGEDRDLGRYIHHATVAYNDFTNAVYGVFGRMKTGKISGAMRTSYPRRVPSISIRGEQGILTVSGEDMSPWSHFQVELTPEAVRFWDHVWSLRVVSSATFETDGRKMVMADGKLTVQNKNRTVVFSASQGQVRMEADGRESFAEEFVLDLTTLEPKR